MTCKLQRIILTRGNLKTCPKGTSSPSHQPNENFNTWCVMNHGYCDFNQYTSKSNGCAQNGEENIENRSWQQK